jgi:hypothetical protein
VAPATSRRSGRLVPAEVKRSRAAANATSMLTDEAELTTKLSFTACSLLL